MSGHYEIFSRLDGSFELWVKQYGRERKQQKLLYSWRFSRYSASFHWLVHGHMISNNETVSRQMPWAGNIAKAMTSNVNSSLLTAVARDCWNLSAVFKFCFRFVLPHDKSLNDRSLGEQWILFLSSRETLRFSGNKIHCSRRGQSSECL